MDITINSKYSSSIMILEQSTMFSIIPVRRSSTFVLMAGFLFADFEETLPQVLDAISASDFIAIDGEFTGLRNGPDVSAYDTPAEYYSKLRDGSLDFLLIQVGVCTFKYDEAKKK